jgi:ATP-dependent exoDNAse (exonuclease V) beta subunit
VREAFERRLASNPGPDEAQACRQALGEIDEAAIATLHGFALRILGEHPLEVGLPPRVQVLDEVSSQLAFSTRWRRFVDELHTDPDAEELLLRAWALGIEIDRPRSASLRDVAEVFEDSWDRLGPTAGAEVAPLPTVDLGPLADALQAMSSVHAACRKPGDTLRTRGAEVSAEVLDILTGGDQLEQLERITACRGGWKVGRGRGSKQSWDDVDAARDALDHVGAVAGEVVQEAVDQVLRRLAVRLATFTVTAAEERRAEGMLDFHDLLVLARRLVRESAVRPRLAAPALPAAAPRRVPGHRPDPDRGGRAHRCSGQRRRPRPALVRGRHRPGTAVLRR